MLHQFSDNFHAQITPVNESLNRPLWSVIIPTHNCALYLRETLQSVLTQALPPNKMEIIVVDDYSSEDNPKAVVDEIGQNRVIFLDHDRNVGKVNNYATGIKASKGIFIHLIHGDDTIQPGFYSKMEYLFTHFAEIGAAFCRANYIDENNKIFQKTGIERETDGILENWLEKIIVSQRIQPPSLVIKRDVYENIGGYDTRLKYMEDWEMYIRIANSYKVAFTPEILANYRVHAASSSQTSISNGTRIPTIRLLFKIVNGYINSKVITTIKGKRNGAQAMYLIQFIPIILHHKDWRAYIKVAFAVFSFSLNFKIIYRFFYFTFSSKFNC